MNGFHMVVMIVTICWITTLAGLRRVFGVSDTHLRDHHEDNGKWRKGKVWAVLPENIQPRLNHPGTLYQSVMSSASTSKRPMFRREITKLSRLYQRKQRRHGTLVTISPLSHHPEVFERVTYGCPTQCSCSYLEVECRSARLQEIPKNLPRYTEKLIITGNSIAHLNSSSFIGLDSLKLLVLSNNQIRVIEPGTFNQLHHLRRLDLRNNRLKCLHVDIFRGLTELRHIHLSENRLLWIPGLTFEDQRQLQILDMGGNPFQCDCSLKPLGEYFLSIHRLKLLAQSGGRCMVANHKETLQPIDAVLLQLDCPDSDVIFHRVPDACATQTAKSCLTQCECSSDRTANCQRRGLTSVPSDLPEELVEINLSHNSLEMLDESSFKRYPNLRKIVLDNNRISQVGIEAFAHLRDLSSLYLSSNRLQSLPPGTFSGLKNLKFLYLHRNKITCVEKGSFRGLENLQILHLSDNQIQTIPGGSFEDMKRLKYLYLVHNPLICDCRLAWMPSVLVEKEAGGTQWARCAGPPNLQGTHVRDLVPQSLQCDVDVDSLVMNSHCEWPKNLCPTGCYCTELTNTPTVHAKKSASYNIEELGFNSDGISVDCTNVGLKSLPESLPSRTKELNLRYNHITTLPKEGVLKSLKQLHTLILDGNRIERIEPLTFAGNDQLKKLILSNNSLTDFDSRSLLGLKSLEILLLQHNKLTCLNKSTFSHTPLLKVLMINNNKIRCIKKGAFENLHLESLSIGANPLKCDCHLSWLPDWLRDNVDQVMAGPLAPTCSQPEELAGTPLASLARYHFTCPDSDTSCSHVGKRRRFIDQIPGNDSCLGTESNCCRKPHTHDPSATGCPAKCTCEADGVYCSDLGLEEIPPNIPPETTQLYLERNQIREVRSDRLASLTKLHTLVLSYNKLQELRENAFEALTSLRTLVLSHNNIQCIHARAFKGLGGLRVLILQGNNISVIPYGTFNELLQLNNIALGQNPLHCDCNGKWLNSFFRQQFLDNGVALCHSPANMRHKSLYHSKPSEFVCPWKQRRRHRFVKQTEGEKDHSIALLMRNAQDEDADKYSGQENELDFPLESDVSPHHKTLEALESLMVAKKCAPCLLNPCANRGVCEPQGQLDYKCVCKSPNHGPQCEPKETACSPNPCQNGGRCEVMHNFGTYRCVCPDAFRGSTCSQRVAHCPQNYCQNGGVCEEFGSGFRCKCPPEFHGNNCEHVSTYCQELNPCLNGGTCIRVGRNQYRCECERGWIGKNCQINHDDCLYNRCENGAICVDGINEYICKCRPGYTGIYCERHTWNPENHVTRMDKRVPFMRKIQGTTSSQVRHSQIKTRSPIASHLDAVCAFHQCQNGATCLDGKSDAYQCICQSGFTGQYCENLFTVNLPSPHSYIAVVPPSRGALVPQGTIGFNIATHSATGIVLYYAEMMQTGVPSDYLLLHLTNGHLQAILSLNGTTKVERRSAIRIDDGLMRMIRINLEAGNMSLQVDDLVQPEKSLIVNGMRNNEPNILSADIRKELHLALTNSLYFGGAPVDRLEIASRILRTDRVVGMMGCLQDIQINNRKIDISRLFGAPVDQTSGNEELVSEGRSPEAKHYGIAIGILPGCEEKGETKIRNASAEIVGQWSDANQSCRQASQRSFIRDPDTDCVSVRRLTVRKCVGACNEDVNVTKSKRRRQSHEPEGSRINEFHLKSCCQATKTRLRRVQFRCLNGNTYRRKIKLVRRCGCDQCLRI